MCRCQDTQQCPPEPRRRTGILGLVLQLCVLYLLLVFGGGTMINTGHPVAVELGKLMHVVTFVEPGINWADDRGYTALAGGLQTLSGGFPLS